MLCLSASLGGDNLPEALQEPSQRDAMLLLAVFAARIGIAEDTEQASWKIRRLLTLAQRHPLFEEQAQTTLERIGLYVNFLAGGMPPKTIEQAADALNAGLRQDVYAWAVDLQEPAPSEDEIPPSLEALRRMLGIKPAIALEHQRIIKKKHV